MTDPDERIPDPLSQGLDPEPDEADSPSALRSFLGLFVVPLFVVLACVAVFIGFGWIAYDQSSTADYVDDLSHWSRPRRAQAAYELSKVLIADPSAMDDEPELAARVRQIYSEGDNPEIRRYLILVLGHTRDREAVPALVDELESDDPESQIYALWALGAIGHPVALEPLREALVDDDPGARKTAAYALGQLGLPEAAPDLRSALQDPTADVRWNAALALARLGSDAGLPVLEEILDRGLTSQVPGITPQQQEDAMIEAIKAVVALGAGGRDDLLEGLAESDPSYKVRQAAIEAMRGSNGSVERAGEG